MKARCFWRVVAVSAFLVASSNQSVVRDVTASGSSPTAQLLPVSPLSQDEARAPFELEIAGFRFTAPEIELHVPVVTRLAFRVVSPREGLSDPGALMTSINGRASATIQSVRSGTQGPLVVCDLGTAGSWLRTGRNVVRIFSKASPYEATYVLILPERPGAQSFAVERYRRGSDRGVDLRVDPIPELENAPSDTAFEATVSGTAIDDRRVMSVSVDGVVATLTATPGDPFGPVRFHSRIKVAAGASQVRVEARDRDNITRLLLPVHRREGRLGPGTVPGTTQRSAVIVGVSRYRHVEDSLGALQYPASDAAQLTSWLLGPQTGGWDPSRVHQLIDATATTEAVRHALSEASAGLGPDDVLLLYIASHGTPSSFKGQPLYFFLHDSRLSSLSSTALSMTEVEEFVHAHTRARVVAFFDACHSGGVLGEKTGEALARRVQAISGNDRLAIMASSGSEESSSESPAAGGGLFTQALLAGLRGEADANTNGETTADELFSFVRETVRKQSPGQTPVAALGGNGSLVLVTHKRPAAQ